MDNEPVPPDLVKLAQEVQNNMAQFLGTAHQKVAPPGILTTGMSLEQGNHIRVNYDPATNAVIVTGIVTVKVTKPKSP
jgi:hypothetical protein